jgi:hypothetical protein
LAEPGGGQNVSDGWQALRSAPAGGAAGVRRGREGAPLR